MAIETTYYGVDWTWFKAKLAESGGMDFFHAILDEEDEGEHEVAADWRDYVLLPEVELWENWGAAQTLAKQFAEFEAIAGEGRWTALRSFLEEVAAIPSLSQNRFTPSADLGRPAEIDPEYLGALSPVNIRRVLDESRLLEAPSFGHLAAKGVPNDSYLYRLPAILGNYRDFLNAVHDRGWGILMTAS